MTATAPARVQGHFITPAGNEARFWLREGTSDFNTANAITAVGDEYHLPTGLTGWALDVGAHIGACAVALLIDNPDLRVVAIEALPENVGMLRDNLALNGVEDRCVVIEGAAGDGSPQRIGYGADGVHDYIGNATAPAGNRETVAEGFGLRDVLAAVAQADRDNWHRRIDIAWTKIDAEGAEFHFLDSIGVDRLDHIEGEVHPLAPDGTAGGSDRLRGLLEATHDVHFPGDDPMFGPFVAVRRSATKGSGW